MKLGDQFKQGSYSHIYTLVQNGFCGEVTVLNTGENTILSTFKCRVKDSKNITKQEFMELLDTEEEWLHQYTNLDGSPLFQEEIYHIGDVFQSENYGKLMLCQVGYGECSLITISRGINDNRMGAPVNVNSIIAITKDELIKMLSSASDEKLEKIENV